MKATVLDVDSYTTTIVTVECPVCGKVNNYEYPFDEGFCETKREEPCPNCDTLLEFCYGEKKW